MHTRRQHEVESDASPIGDDNKQVHDLKIRSVTVKSAIFLKR